MVLYNGLHERSAALQTVGQDSKTDKKRHQARIVRMRPADETAREREFERLYLQSYELVYNYVRYRMTDDTAAEDVIAEAFLSAARSFDRFDPRRAKFSTWVISIAKNCIINYYRKDKPTVPLEDVPTRAVATSGEHDNVDDRLLVDQLLGSLDDVERELVVLKYRDGMRNVDIARELHMNASTVSTKLANALSKMRAVMQKGA